MMREYLAILEEELVVAIGCTEPIAVVYAAAKASEVLGSYPEKVVIKCSGNFIKNAKSVEIPNGNGLKGILACVALGFIVKGSDKELEILKEVTLEQLEATKNLLEKNIIILEKLDTLEKLHIIIECTKDEDVVMIELKRTHNNISKVVKNGEILFEENLQDQSPKGYSVDRSIMSVQGICEFVEQVDVEELKNLFDQVMRHNTEIANTGLSEQYGNEVARTISKYYGEENIYLKLKTMGSAGSDARMGGCPYPVVTVVGSGNQGMTCSLPIIEYAKYKNASEEQCYRALAMGLLMSIHQKTGIGRLSAYCGAVSAACGAACGMSYLERGADVKVISDTVTNALSIASGMVCDGAKPSCAAKIATSLDSAILGHLMALEGNVFEAGTGLVKADVEKTIAAVGTLARVGMQKTDEVILDIMLES
ncbi:MAG: L-serine ammonia-lyase, iron-sulfur-dependent, subunit alpha [Niameybacter sp.]|uniref:L-cysteine desulfidase family protein n=2 Tax=Niameybacter sp. TaxID=2033640 RepID=UPI002FCC225A